MTFGSLCHLRRSLAHVPLVRSLASRLWFRVILAPRCEFFDFRSTSNCFVACLGHSFTYLLYAHSFPSCSLRNSLLFVKVQGAFGVCRSCRRSRRQGVIYHLPKLKSTLKRNLNFQKDILRDPLDFTFLNRGVGFNYFILSKVDKSIPNELFFPVATT